MIYLDPQFINKLTELMLHNSKSCLAKLSLIYCYLFSILLVYRTHLNRHLNSILPIININLTKVLRNMQTNNDKTTYNCVNNYHCMNAISFRDFPLDLLVLNNRSRTVYLHVKYNMDSGKVSNTYLYKYST